MIGLDRPSGHSDPSSANLAPLRYKNRRDVLLFFSIVYILVLTFRDETKCLNLDQFGKDAASQTFKVSNNSATPPATAIESAIISDDKSTTGSAVNSGINPVAGPVADPNPVADLATDNNPVTNTATNTATDPVVDPSTMGSSVADPNAVADPAADNVVNPDPLTNPAADPNPVADPNPTAEPEAVVITSVTNNDSNVNGVVNNYAVPSDVPSLPDVDDPWKSFLSPDENVGFVGAEEWYQQWSNLPTNTGGINGNNNGERNEDYATERHKYDAYVASKAESIALETRVHLGEMQKRYENVNALPDFMARGLGWVYARLGMALTVIVVGREAGNGNFHAETSDPISIFVVDTIGKLPCGNTANKGNWTNWQPPLTMWVRAIGPEIFAGTAMPHLLMPSASNHRCTWRYDFAPNEPGQYAIHVKLLTYRGFATFDSDKCKVAPSPSNDVTFLKQLYNRSIPGDLERLEQKNAEVVHQLATEHNFSHHRGILGFKMYGTIDACCEACSRARGCRMWSVPGANHFDECELYFSKIEDDLDFLHYANGNDGGIRGNTHYLGRERNYSYVKQTPDDFPEFRRRLLADDIMINEKQHHQQRRRRLAIGTEDIHKIWPVGNAAPSFGYSRNEPTTYFIGCGWSSMMSFENPCHFPSDDVVHGSGKKIQIIQRPGQQATPSSITSPSHIETRRECSLQDEKLNISRGRWVRRPFPDNSTCPPIERDTSNEHFRNYRPIYHGDRPPECWHRDDLTKIAQDCGETGCVFVIKHRWRTELFYENQWFGMWEPYDCRYRDFGDDELQQCIYRKKIQKIELRGSSVKNIILEYVDQKLQKINMTEPGPDTKTVFLDTLSMPHLLWHETTSSLLQKLDNSHRDISNRSDIEHYWVTGFYFTSEREPHVQVDRSVLFSKLASDLLEPRGYKTINALDSTAAFAFDTDAQNDGLHMVGPPIRSIVTKFFHHLCHEG